MDTTIAVKTYPLDVAIRLESIALAVDRVMAGSSGLEAIMASAHSIYQERLKELNG